MDKLESASELRASIEVEMAMFRRDAERSSLGETQSEDAKRRLSNEVIEDLAGRWEKVIALMKEGGASAAMLDEARAQSSADLAWLMAERKRREAPAGDEGTRGLERSRGGPLMSGGVIAHGAADEHERRRAPSRERPSREHGIEPGAVLVPSRDLPDLREDEFQARLQKSSLLADKRAEIERLSQLVYGNPIALSAAIDGIDGPQAGSAAAQDVRNGRFGPLAGEAGGFLRTESPERQAAKDHLPQLAAALEDYGRSVEFERHQTETRHRDEQHRHRQEIRAPSNGLAAILDAPAHEQTARLNTAPQFRRELDSLATAINRRLTPADRTALKAGDAGRLSASMGLSRDQAQALARVHAQTQAINGQLHLQRQQLDRTRNTALSLKR